MGGLVALIVLLLGLTKGVSQYPYDDEDERIFKEMKKRAKEEEKFFKDLVKRAKEEEKFFNDLAKGWPGDPGGGKGKGKGGKGPDAWMDDLFRRQDQNGDGLVNYDEMPEPLRAERDKWDANRDGFIDLNEYRVYLQGRMRQLAGEGGADFGRPGIGPDGLPIEEERKPVVYRFGKLPPELPAWFAEFDTDKDAQIGLYEWRQSGRPLQEFRAMDRNDDGFLTAEEVLRLLAKQTKDQDGLPADLLVRSGGSAGGGGNGLGGSWMAKGGGPRGFDKGLKDAFKGPKGPKGPPGGGPGKGKGKKGDPG
jgi:Ca2+-binding EF-hand superfamily protein